MRYVLEHLESRRAALTRHALFAWLADPCLSPRAKLAFAPLFVTFVMGFRDMNRWFLRYPAPRDPLERAINNHTHEDATHSRLFLEDWRKLGLDEELCWAPSDVVYWYYAAPETETFREFGFEILQRIVVNADPRIRFVLMEAIEVCGNVFFSATAPVAAELGRRSGLEYRYFGSYHLQRETGHVLGSEGVFAEIQLDDELRAAAVAQVDRIFEMFEVECDELLAYARRRIAAPGARPKPVEESDIGPRGEELRAAASGGAAHPTQAPIRDVLEDRKRRAAEHPLFRWMRAPDGLAAERKLTRFVPLWIPDILGYRDLSAYALAYRWPKDARERAINRRTADLTTHHRLFLRDFRELGLDRSLSWTASETLEFYTLSQRTELQRSSLATFVKLAYANPEPVLRHWLIEALEASGHAFFEHTAELARSVERDGTRRLDYLGNRHDLSHPERAPDPDAEAVCFETEPMNERQVHMAIHMVHTVFDCLERQFTQSFALAAESCSTSRECRAPGPTSGLSTPRLIF